MKYKVDRAVLHDAIQQAEQKFDVLSWNIQGVQVWPLIRHKFSLGYLLDRFRSSWKSNPLKRLLLVLKGVKELTVLLFVFRIKSKPYEYLFLTKSSYRTKIDGQWYEKFCDSTVDELGKDFKNKACILESGVDLQYRKPRYQSASVFEVQGAFYLIGLFAQLFSRRGSASIPEYENFKSWMQTQTGFSSPLTLAQLEREMIRINAFSDFFSFILKSTPLKKIFTICYYEESGYGMMLTAEKRNITSVDIQHGSQGKFHFAYMPFGKIPTHGYNLVPDFFWLWNKPAYDNIANWNSSVHKPFLGGNLWLQRWKTKSFDKLSEKPIVLVSLQPVADALPRILLEAIADTADTYSWFLRLHPRQMEDRAQLEKVLEEAKVLGKVELTHATEQPLPVLLLQTFVHITQWSSVVIEAAEFGVPSILIHPTGKLVYSAEEFGSHFIHYAENKQHICEILEKLYNRMNGPLSTEIKPDIAGFVYAEN